MKRIAAVILTYRPDQDILVEAVRSLCPQVERVLFVDNGTPWDAGPLLNALPEAHRPMLEFIWLERNLGVGAGHNVGIRWARDHGYSHVLILDHDSIPAPDMVSRLSAALDRLGKEGIPAAAVGPRYVDRYTGSISAFVRLGRIKLSRATCTEGRTGELIETDFIISSGALIPMAVLDAVGEMDEGMFIDHVDTEWVFRAKALGYHAFGVCDALMNHSLGTATFRFWLLRWRTVPLHSPERHYYVFRNGVILLGRRYAPARWVIIDIIRLCGMAVIFPVFAPDRLRRISLMARGLLDGFRGVSGPLR